jgi:DNA ligase (NAD+)
VNQIENSKKESLEKLLIGLGIKHIGQRTALILAQHYQTMEKFMKTTLDNLLEIREIGLKIATSIINFFKNASNQNLINQLHDYGVQMTFQGEAFTSQPQLKIAITGVFDLPRNKLINQLQKHNILVVSKISKQCDYLLSGNQPSGKKINFAHQEKIPIISKEDL